MHARTQTYTAPEGHYIRYVNLYIRFMGVAGSACVDQVRLRGSSTGCASAHHCNGHGVCHFDACKCESGYLAPHCCPLSRAGHQCQACAPGYFGTGCAACSEQHSRCSGHGRCDDGVEGSGRCRCVSERWTGELCHECAPGHFGPDCLPCPSCNGHGRCEDTIAGTGRCACFPGFSGAHCTTSCSGRGQAVQDSSGNWRCECNWGWSGTRCELATEPLVVEPQASVAIIPNPGRGWYSSGGFYASQPNHQDRVLVPQQCSNCPTDHPFCCKVLSTSQLRSRRQGPFAMTLAQRVYVLSGVHQDSDTLQPGVLALMRADLRAARAAGVTLIWRLAYSSTESVQFLDAAHAPHGSDVPLSRALLHMEQIESEVLQRADVFSPSAAAAASMLPQGCRHAHASGALALYETEGTWAAGQAAPTFSTGDIALRLSSLLDCVPRESSGVHLTSDDRAALHAKSPSLDLRAHARSLWSLPNDAVAAFLAPLADSVDIIQAGVAGPWGCVSAPPAPPPALRPC